MWMFMIAGLAMSALGAGCKRDSATKPASPLQGEEAPLTEAQAAEKKLREVLTKAKSWHMDVIGDLNGHKMSVSTDIVCPDRQHGKTLTKDGPAETIGIGQDIYTRSNAGWTKSTAPPGVVIPSPCPSANLGAAGSKFDKPWRLTKGTLKTVRGESCQDWKVEGFDSPTTYCVGSDGLPRESTNGSTVAYYSNWDKIPPIEPPVTTASSPK
jgi:hypothetical protein